MNVRLDLAKHQLKLIDFCDLLFWLGITKHYIEEFSHGPTKSLAVWGSDREWLRIMMKC